MNLEQHPVSPEMRERILIELKRIEHIHNVKIIYACESGSRGWGFASTNSDYDVRFVYVNHPKHYVRVDNEARETIEHVVNKELDICGWSITKALGLIYKSNPAFLEWLDSPIQYIKIEEDYNELYQLANANFVHITSYEHYMSMLRRQKKEWLSTDEVYLKKYFYAIRPLLAAIWVTQRQSIPPMVFQSLLEIVHDPELLETIHDLVDRKRICTEKEKISRIKVLDNFIDAHIGQPAPVFPGYDRTDLTQISSIAWKFVDRYSAELKPVIVVKEEGVFINV